MSVAPPKSMMKKCQKINNSSLLKKRPKTKNNSKASTVSGVNATAGTENVSQTIPRLPAALLHILVGRLLLLQLLTNQYLHLSLRC